MALIFAPFMGNYEISIIRPPAAYFDRFGNPTDISMVEGLQTVSAIIFPIESCCF
jgi:hypothetical protein